jgi:hypothetical protein
MRLQLVLILVAASAGLTAACESTSGVQPPPRVQFRLTSNVGPCSSDISIRFTSDGALLGEEDFRINYAPNRTESSLFQAPVGTQTLRAQITRWGTQTTTTGYTWPDTTVTLERGQTLVREIDLYCS